jgi:hypothetical protein
MFLPAGLLIYLLNRRRQVADEKVPDRSRP